MLPKLCHDRNISHKWETDPYGQAANPNLALGKSRVVSPHLRTRDLLGMMVN